MKVSLLSFSIALCTIALAANTQAQLGAQVHTKQAFRYGKLVATLKLSPEKGIVNGVFMLKFFPNNKWPNGWTEIDYEYVPGNNDAQRRAVSGNCGPGGQSCVIGQLGQQNAGDFISVNIIGGAENTNPWDHGDSQVFYKLSKEFLVETHTYTIEFTPTEVRWGVDGVNDNRPIMYQRPARNNDTVHSSIGLDFLKDRDMNIYFNCYSGLGDSGSFGGTGVIPHYNTEMVVEKVAFYPMNSDGSFSAQPSMSSDFKTNHYTLGGSQSGFDNIWAIDNRPVSKDNWPVYTRAANSQQVFGQGLVMKFTP